MPTFASTDAPRAAIPIKNHRYQIPRYPLDRPMEQGEAPIQGVGMLQNWTRASTIVDTHKDKENLIKWRSRLVAKGMGDREDLVALAAATRLADRTTLNSVADQAFDHAKGQAASNLGSALHGFLERTLNGERDLVIPDRWAPDVAGVLATFQDLGIKLNAAHQELVIVRPDLKDGDAAGLAGRFDLLGEYRGKLTVIDYKTGSDPLEYGAWEIQQKGGLYATGWAVWDGEFWHPMPEVRDDLTLMVHVLPGRGKDGVTVHEVDLDVAELELDLAAAYRTRARRKAAKKAHRVVTDVAARVTTPDMLEQERKRDERLAKVDAMAKAAGRNDDPDDEGPGSPAPGNTCDCLGDGDWHPPAATCATVTITDQTEGPEAHNARIIDSIGSAILNGEGKPLQPLADPGERGCSVCGRKGHRKGGKACLGSSDPGPVAYAQAPIKDEQAATERTHTHGVNGWSRNPLDGLWYCGTEGCDQQAALAVQDELTADQESAFPGQVTPAELEAAAEAQQADHDAAEEPDPFGDAEEETAEAHAVADQARWLAQINEASDKAAIRDIRARSTEAGQWNDELLQAGLARIKTFK